MAPFGHHHHQTAGFIDPQSFDGHGVVCLCCYHSTEHLLVLEVDLVWK